MAFTTRRATSGAVRRLANTVLSFAQVMLTLAGLAPDHLDLCVNMVRLLIAATEGFALPEALRRHAAATPPGERTGRVEPEPGSPGEN